MDADQTSRLALVRAYPCSEAAGDLLAPGEYTHPSGDNGAMRQTIHLGRVGGVSVGLHWSVVVTFGLLTWTLAAYELPQTLPGRADFVHWSAAAITAILFLGSLLLHELAHALTARRLQVAVQGITLWLFGGVARIRGDQMTARSELRIASAGPALSFLLAGIFAVAASLGDGAPGTVLEWLARINLVLAVFNLVPAFPMDGGRILRALLWQRKGRSRATAIAAYGGKGFAFLLIGLGLVLVSMRDPLGGMWLAFLGLFLSNAAEREESHLRRTEQEEGGPD